MPTDIQPAVDLAPRAMVRPLANRETWQVPSFAIAAQAEPPGTAVSKHRGL